MHKISSMLRVKIDASFNGSLLGSFKQKNSD